MHIPTVVKIHWYLLKLSSGNENTDLSRTANSVKNLQNLPISNPKPDLPSINAYTKIHLLKLSSGYEKTDVSQADNSVKSWRNSPISNLKRDLYNFNVHTKFGEKPLIFIQVKRKYRRTYGRRTDATIVCRGIKMRNKHMLRKEVLTILTNILS